MGALSGDPEVDIVCHTSRPTCVHVQLAGSFCAHKKLPASSTCLLLPSLLKGYRAARKCQSLNTTRTTFIHLVAKCSGFLPAPCSSSEACPTHSPRGPQQEWVPVTHSSNPLKDKPLIDFSASLPHPLQCLLGHLPISHLAQILVSGSAFIRDQAKGLKQHIALLCKLENSSLLPAEAAWVAQRGCCSTCSLDEAPLCRL